MTELLIYPNGVNGNDGRYITQAHSARQIIEISLSHRLGPRFLEELKDRAHRKEPTHGLPLGVDPSDLAQSGWGVILPSGMPEDVLEALSPLLNLRLKEAGILYKVYAKADGYLQGDTVNTWLSRSPRHKAPGMPDCKKVPYYLLLVGSAEQIPFRFQYELSVNYAVGRVHFDAPEHYRRYAETVVRACITKPPAHRKALLFGPRNQGDVATQLSADRLLTPLANSLEKHVGDSWAIETCIGYGATKAALINQLFETDQTPALVFTASHGMGFPLGDSRQEHHQGALLCQDWPGPLLHNGSIPSDFYFSADDITDNRELNGAILMNFACFSGGTPRWDNFKRVGHPPVELASKDFIAALPKRALSLHSGALAVISHIERAWSYSFAWPNTQSELTTFENVLFELLIANARLGWAMEAFRDIHASLVVQLQGHLDDYENGANLDELQVSQLHLAGNDARNYVVFGDPAVKL
jgi:hypothetical protein